ncbi:MAG TPA: hypothetical protein VF134_08070 [Candidatus Dormibacteraeota bacterium]
MHFADGSPSGDAEARLLREEIGSWQPARGADWEELMARAEGSKRRRWAIVVGGVVWVALMAAAGALLAQQLNPLFLEEVRSAFLP